tara:strand:+ start:1918 stop:2229 length:312 start_codon:yes stop_codon:yes gene_type:complete
MKKQAFFFIALFLLVLLQVSFLPHIPVFGIVPNLVLLFVILLSLFEYSSSNTSLQIALIGGFLLDIFSQRPFGFWTFLLVTVAFLLKYVIHNYVRLPFFQTTS